MSESVDEYLAAGLQAIEDIVVTFDPVFVAHNPSLASRVALEQLVRSHTQNMSEKELADFRANNAYALSELTEPDSEGRRFCVGVLSAIDEVSRQRTKELSATKPGRSK